MLRQVFEPEIQQETQQQDFTTTQPQETQTEYLNQQTTSTAQTDNETPSGLTKTLFCELHRLGNNPFLTTMSSTISRQMKATTSCI